MTINKSQGQTVKHVGLDLRSAVFTHGQFYVGVRAICYWNRLILGTICQQCAAKPDTPVGPMRKALIIFGKSLLALLSLAGVALLWFTGWLIWYYEYGIGLPTESTLSALSPTDHVCATGAHGAFVPLADIPPLIRNAVVAYEDPDFYKRPSAGPLAQFALAVVSDRRPTASNISSWVTRSCLKTMSPECCKGIDWHIGSLVLMGRVERALSRDRILEIYLNDTYFGRNADGVAMAAEAYFSKRLAELEIHEIAFMLARARGPHPRSISRRFSQRSRHRSHAEGRGYQRGAGHNSQGPPTAAQQDADRRPGQADQSVTASIYPNTGIVITSYP